jgi:hypothetical protein
MSAELAGIFREVSSSSEVSQDKKVPTLYGLPEKSTKEGRFSLLGVPFLVAEATSHPRSLDPIYKLTTSTRAYLIFLSYFYRDPSSDSSEESSELISSKKPKTLTLTHPALKPLHTSKELKNYKDVSRAVFYGQLTAALQAGGPVLVPDIRKVTPASYRSEYIPYLQTSFSLNTFDSVEDFTNLGGVHLLVVNKLIRNADTARSNIGSVARKKLVAFDFDCAGSFDLGSVDLVQAQSWGFSPLGADRAGWVPPPTFDSTHLYGKGPSRWPDRRIKSLIAKPCEDYYLKQDFWRQVFHHPAAVHIQHILYFKFLLMSPEWLEAIQVGYLGRDRTAREILKKTLGMRRDVESTLKASAIFRLDLFLNAGKYRKTILADFEFYNLAKDPKEKPKNKKYQLELTEERFEQVKRNFLESGDLVEDEVELDSVEHLELQQDQKFAYLQFLVLLSHAKGSSLEDTSAYDPSSPKNLSLRGTLDSEHEKKLSFFLFLFASVKSDCSYSELFFLCKAFDILYPTHHRDSEKDLVSYGFSSLVFGKGKALNFPNWRYFSPFSPFVTEDFHPSVNWAFTHFSVESLTSGKARDLFPGRWFVDSLRVGQEFHEAGRDEDRFFARKEACLQMGALISNQLGLSP